VVVPADFLHQLGMAFFGFGLCHAEQFSVPESKEKPRQVIPVVLAMFQIRRATRSDFVHLKKNYFVTGSFTLIEI
jgi:hypothetical protein